MHDVLETPPSQDDDKHRETLKGEDNHLDSDEKRPQDSSSHDSPFSSLEPQTNSERRQRHTHENVDVERSAASTGLSDSRSGMQEDEKQSFMVKWDDGEKANPRNFSAARKAFLTFLLGMLALSASLGSSIISPAEAEIAKDLGIAHEITVFSVSLYVLGFVFGPLLWAPVSEVYGRKISMLPALVGLALFSIGTAVSRNAASVFITRFFSGVFGSAPVSNVSAALGDLYEPRARGIAVSFYAVCTVGGPTLGPTIAAAILVAPGLDWRWTEYVEAIFVFGITILSLFLMPELYAPVLLQRKARRLREETRDNRYWHPHESVKISISNIVTKHTSRPLRMLTTEPMVTCIAIYASFVYGLVYLTLEVFPIVYQQERKWGTVVSTLPFLGLFVGVFVAILINLAFQPQYARALEKNGGRAVPEARLPPMIVGANFFAVGLFMFAWTANPKISWVPSVIATVFIGAGFNVIFQQCINFLVDTYGLYAASAVSANTFLRSIFAFGLPLAAPPMFNSLGVGPAGSILGAVAVLALPVPLIFMKYGPQLRKMSKFAPAED